MEAVSGRQRRSEPFDPVLDVFWGQTGERSQVDADDTKVVPLLGVTSDAVPAAMPRLIFGDEDGRADPAVAATGTKHQMVKVLRDGAGHRHPRHGNAPWSSSCPLPEAH